MENDTPKALGALQVDETKLMDHVHDVVRSSVEEKLNALLDAEADEICGAKRYERSSERVDTRAGHYERKLETKAGAVTLKVPKRGACRLRRRSFSVIVAKSPRSRRRWWRCTWQECRCDASKTSPKRCGAPG
jgi:transposase-like protein